MTDTDPADEPRRPATETDADDIDELRTRVDALESLVAEQRDLIELQRGRLAELAGAVEAGNGVDRRRRASASVTRRGALTAGGLLALLGLGAGNASADPQGQVGTSGDPLNRLFTRALSSGDDAIEIDVDGSLTPNGTHDLGAAGTPWRDAFVGTLTSDDVRTESVRFDDGSTLVGAGRKTGPIRIRSFHSSSNLPAGAEQSVGTQSDPGYALAYYCSTTGAAPGIASDLDWRFYYENETSPSFDMIAIGDSLAPPGVDRHEPNEGSHWTGNSSRDSYSWVTFEQPAPFDSVDARVHNPTNTDVPEVDVLVFLAEELDLAPMGEWRRHADGEEDQSLPDGGTETLVNVSGTRGRLYGLWMDLDDADQTDTEFRVTMDNESTPSFSINTGEVVDLFRGNEATGGGIFTMGEYNSGSIQVSWAFTPGHMGYYSDFESSMTVEAVNNSGPNVELDWSVAWDEEV